VTGAPASSTFYYTVSFTGSAIASMTMEGAQSTTYGITAPTGSPAGRISGEPSPGVGATITGSFGPTNDIAFALIPPGEMGAGTYTDTITITVCNDAKCASPVSGSPAKILITYIVTGNPVPNTLFTPENASFTLEAPTSSASAPTTTTTITTINLPPIGAYVFTSIGTGAAIASATLQSNLNGTGTLTITGKPPASLGSGVYQDSVEVKVCFDAACTKPAAHTPFTFPVTYVVDASVGTDFTMQTIPNEIQEMVWSAANQRIYAIAPGYAASDPNSLLVINPVLATIESVVSLDASSDPVYLAVSDDGQFAYVAASIPYEVVRVNLSTLTIDETLPLSASCVGIAVAPAQAHTVAVTTYNDVTTLAVFDDAVQRTQTFSTGSIEIPLMFGWGADATTMYAYDESISGGTMYQLAAAASGLSVSQQTAGIVMGQSFFSNMQLAGGLVYSGTSGVFNPATGTTLPPYPLQSTNGNIVSSGSFAVDTALGRLYAITDDQPLGMTTGDLTIEGFNMTTRSPTWIARFASPQGGESLIRWGTNGLAFTTGGVTPTITLISGSIVSR
jgi:hypothetical protein